MSRGSCQQGKAQNTVIHPCLLLLSPASLPVLPQDPEPWQKLVLYWSLSLIPSSLPVSKIRREKPILPLLFLEVFGSEEPRDTSSPLLHSVQGSREQAGVGQGGTLGDWRVSGRSPGREPRGGDLGRGDVGVLEPPVSSALLSQPCKQSPPRPAVSPHHSPALVMTGGVAGLGLLGSSMY